MKTNEDKHTEELVNKLMKSQPLATTSFDFTLKVMDQVVEAKNKSVFTYKPLISKQTAFAAFCITTLLIVYTILNSNSSSSKLISVVDLNSIFKYKLSDLFNFSTITMYGIVLGSIMLLGQITFLQNHFSTRD